ncbi:DUF3047 domain-containing protein [Piscinibacter sakaiensis]|uniref:DUF3047 domain-containing protein n=1 Tax=Piscinibacter sakaiensis TaxID=1547922 RepID=A0A0K8NWY0_PISS1|nr:DUF3047 domain-containing protein [Piscinibacter sakaiensis]GAP34789.1 hypothetical protein ISF6_0272 [Piscinibacter sakaiensis]
MTSRPARTRPSCHRLAPHALARPWLAAIALTSVLGLSACALPERTPAGEASVPAAAAWAEVGLPGKRATRYRFVASHDGRPAVAALSEGSASMLRRRLRVEPADLGSIRFDWWVPSLIPSADLRDRDAADSPVRVVLAFDGDHARLSPRNRMMFELAQTLTGEAPPYATLMYVWDNAAPLESVIPGGRSDRIRKIVVDAGPTGLREWRRHERDIARDFERAFGEPPGPLIGVALMTDSDNTVSRAAAYYGSIELLGRGGTATRRLLD